MWLREKTRVQVPLLGPKNPMRKHRIFLSKPQAWHIITARSVVHIISPFGAVSHHALACIYLRLDDIQNFVLMICNSCGIDDIHAFGVILRLGSKPYYKTQKYLFRSPYTEKDRCFDTKHRSFYNKIRFLRNGWILLCRRFQKRGSGLVTFGHSSKAMRLSGTAQCTALVMTVCTQCALKVGKVSWPGWQ